MVRRKRDAGCFNTASFNGTVTQQGLCNCTLADTGQWHGAAPSGC